MASIAAGKISATAVPEVQIIATGFVKALMYAESLSQLKGSPQIQNQFLISSDVLVKKAFQEKVFDSVIRIGGIPTLRFWRDLEFEFKDVPVFNFSNLPFTGLSRSSKWAALDELSQVKIEQTRQANETIQRRDQELQIKKLELLRKYPRSEPAFVASLSDENGDLPIYLGNSLPIRHWDAFSCNHSKPIYANRGANGIDGQISTYLGWSESFNSSACFVGDLTAMYDLAALGFAPYLTPHKRRIFVMNNFGGQIFQRVFKNDLFINHHEIDFQHWALMWKWNYILIRHPEQMQKVSATTGLNAVIEIQPDAEQSKLFWNEWDLICQKM